VDFSTIFLLKIKNGYDINDIVRNKNNFKKGDKK